jgi:hypothetical protein
MIVNQLAKRAADPHQKLIISVSDIKIQLNQINRKEM